jgi:hypothetical protein
LVEAAQEAHLQQVVMVETQVLVLLLLLLVVAVAPLGLVAQEQVKMVDAVAEVPIMVMLFAEVLEVVLAVQDLLWEETTLLRAIL